MSVKRKDLADIGDRDFSIRQGEYMQCQKCGESIGGTQGDYFMYAMDDVLTCPACQSENLAIVRDIVKTVKVKH